MVDYRDNLCCAAGARWGLRPQTPVIGSRSALVMSPHFYDEIYAYGRLVVSAARKIDDACCFFQPVTSLWGRGGEPPG